MIRAAIIFFKYAGPMDFSAHNVRDKNSGRPAASFIIVKIADTKLL